MVAWPRCLIRNTSLRYDSRPQFLCECAGVPANDALGLDRGRYPAAKGPARPQHLLHRSSGLYGYRRRPAFAGFAKRQFRGRGEKLLARRTVFFAATFDIFGSMLPARPITGGCFLHNSLYVIVTLPRIHTVVWHMEPRLTCCASCRWACTLRM